MDSHLITCQENIKNICHTWIHTGLHVKKRSRTFAIRGVTSDQMSVRAWEYLSYVVSHWIRCREKMDNYLPCAASHLIKCQEKTINTLPYVESHMIRCQGNIESISHTLCHTGSDFSKSSRTFVILGFTLDKISEEMDNNLLFAGYTGLIVRKWILCCMWNHTGLDIRKRSRTFCHTWSQNF